MTTDSFLDFLDDLTTEQSQETRTQELTKNSNFTIDLREERAGIITAYKDLQKRYMLTTEPRTELLKALDDATTTPEQLLMQAIELIGLALNDDAFKTTALLKLEQYTKRRNV